MGHLFASAASNGDIGYSIRQVTYMVLSEEVFRFLFSVCFAVNSEQHSDLMPSVGMSQGLNGIRLEKIQLDQSYHSGGT